MSCAVGHRHGLDLALLWLWYRPAATAPIRLLAWKPLYAMGTALEKTKKKKKKKKEKHHNPKDVIMTILALFFLVILCTFYLEIMVYM